MRRRCNNLWPNASARLATSLTVVWLSLTCQISQPLAQIVSSPRELAIIRINVLDLLVHEQSLPLLYR